MRRTSRKDKLNVDHLLADTNRTAVHCTTNLFVYMCYRTVFIKKVSQKSALFCM